MKTSHLILILSFLLLALICNDVEDTLVHHYDTSIFAGFGHDSYFYPDWTRLYDVPFIDSRVEWYKTLPDSSRVYYKNMPVQLNKTFIGQWMPFLLDGWHGAKFIRYWSLGTVLLLMAWILSGNSFWGWRKKWWLFYWSGILVWSVIVLACHSLFYGVLLR